jgi:uncharacterized coiled-coil DUF342 family protein
MTVSFDTLSFAKRLTEAGEKPEVAEAHAMYSRNMYSRKMALKEFVMETIATKADIRDLRNELRAEIQDVRDEVQDVRQEIGTFRKEVSDRFATKGELRHEIGLLRKDIDAMGLKLTVRMGGMLAIAVGAVATLGKVF